MKFIPPKFYVQFDPVSKEITGCYNVQPSDNFIEITEDEYVVFAQDTSVFNKKIAKLNEDTKTWILTDKIVEQVKYEPGVFLLNKNDNDVKVVKKESEWEFHFPEHFPTGVGVVIGLSNTRNPFKIFKSFYIWCDGTNPIRKFFTTEEEKGEVFLFANNIFKDASYEVEK